MQYRQLFQTFPILLNKRNPRKVPIHAGSNHKNRERSHNADTNMQVDRDSVSLKKLMLTVCKNNTFLLNTGKKMRFFKVFKVAGKIFITTVSKENFEKSDDETMVDFNNKFLNV